jgi:NADH:ubiquinone oxidoreductase subunit D
METYERFSGARMHAAFIRPGGIIRELPYLVRYDILELMDRLIYTINEIEDMLSKNRI